MALMKLLAKTPEQRSEADIEELVKGWALRFPWFQQLPSEKHRQQIVRYLRGGVTPTVDSLAAKGKQRFA